MSEGHIFSPRKLPPAGYLDGLSLGKSVTYNCGQPEFSKPNLRQLAGMLKVRATGNAIDLRLRLRERIAYLRNFESESEIWSVGGVGEAPNENEGEGASESGIQALPPTASGIPDVSFDVIFNENELKERALSIFDDLKEHLRKSSAFPSTNREDAALVISENQRGIERTRKQRRRGRGNHDGFQCSGGEENIVGVVP